MLRLQYVFFVVVASVQLSAAHIELPAELQQMIDETKGSCIAETGVDEALVAAAEKMEIQSDPKLKCFFKCMMVSMHVMDKDGVFDPAAVMEAIPEDLKTGAQDILDKCKDMKSDDPCDTAYELLACFAKNAEVIAEMFA